MDFEKIVEAIPIGVAIWRIESDYRVETDIHDFRLVYANSKASEEVSSDLFDAIGKKLDSIPPGIINRYPTMPDVWLRALIQDTPEIIEKKSGDKIFEVHIIPLDSRNVASIFRDITAEKKTVDSTNKSLMNIQKVSNELKEFSKRRSGKFKL